MKQFLLTLLFTSVLFATSQALQAQNAPVIQWERSFGGSGDDVLTGIHQNSDGSYLLAGISDSNQNTDKSQNSKGDKDFWIIKLDSVGNKIWDKTIGGTGPDILNSFQKTADGGYMLAGYSSSGISGDKSSANKGPVGSFDFWIVKLDSAGNVAWDKTIGGDQNDELQVLKQTADGGYILGGRSNSGISGDKSHPAFYGNYDFWVVKTDSIGNVAWNQTFGGNNDEDLLTMEQTADGGYVLGGYSTSGMGGNKTSILYGMFDYWIVKLNASGIKQWERDFGCGANDIVNTLKQTPDGGYIVGGFTELNVWNCSRAGLSKGVFDYSLMKLDQNGGKMWEKIIGGNQSDFLQSLQITPDSGYVLAGYSLSGVSHDKTEANRGMEDIWVVKVNSSGLIEWDKTIGGDDRDGFFGYNGMTVVPFQITQTKDKGFLVGAYSKSDSSGDKSSSNKGLFDYWIVKLVPTVISGISRLKQDNFIVYPNPTTGIININIRNHAPFSVMVYNALGKAVVEQSYSKGNNGKLKLDLTKEPKGVYTIQVLSENQVITKKVVLQ